MGQTERLIAASLSLILQCSRILMQC